MFSLVVFQLQQTYKLTFADSIMKCVCSFKTGPFYKQRTFYFLLVEQRKRGKKGSLKFALKRNGSENNRHT